MKIGLLGGTFDPPHLVHLALARAAIEQLELDEVLWIPACETPLKKRSSIATGVQRLEMVQLMIGEESKMGVTDIELTREDISYTVETLKELIHARSAQYWLILGSDAGSHLRYWKQPDEILTYCRLAIGMRPPQIEAQLMGSLPEYAKEKVDLLKFPAHRISSAELRQMIAQGIDVRKWIDPKVKEYVFKNGLYL